MANRKKIIKWSILSFLTLIIVLVLFGVWFISLIPKGSISKGIETQISDLPYLTQDSISSRGKILAVVTSTSQIASNGKKTGYELTELSRAYYIFEANGFEVDIASPKGGLPPVIKDDEDMGAYDYAFLNDSIAQHKALNTIPLAAVDPDDYSAVYFVGGKGAMFDFPNNSVIHQIVASYYQTGKVVGAVCHGPAAFVNVKLDDGTSILDNKRICSFTNKEELFLIPDAATVFPFLLQTRLEEKGAQFIDGTMYLKNVTMDGNLVTGQNPWSTWAIAETMIEQMGYEPKQRSRTGEENAIEVLMAYEKQRL